MTGPRRCALSRFAAAVALALSLVLAACTPAIASDVRITHALFGVHDGTPSSDSFGKIHEGAVRLWDVGAQWNQIETSPGHYSWSHLDTLVEAAQAAHAEVTMVVAMTPSFYSSDPSKLPAKNLPHFTAFVRHLMTRYRSFHGSRGINAYEVWNEANITTFWGGSQHEMAVMAQRVFQVRNHVDPHAQVISPPMVTLQPYQLTWMRQFFAQRVDGTPVAHFYDAISLSLYPHAKRSGRTGTPEDSMRVLAEVRRLLRSDGVSPRKAIWNTEVNYGIQIGKLLGHASYPISNLRQAAFVARTYLLNAAYGVKRVFWYRYDWKYLPTIHGTIGNTLLTDPHDTTKVTPAGHAFLLVQRWMHGRLVGRPGHRPCATDSHGTYTCVVTDSSGTRRIYWNPSGKARVRLAKGARHKQGVLGSVTTVRGGSTLTVSFAPVMVYR